MISELQGSQLTQAILEKGNKRVWCAVSNISDDHAMLAVNNSYYELLVPIVASNNDSFICAKGNLWQYAVSVKRTELTANEVGL